MKNVLYFLPATLAGAVLLVLTGCEDKEPVTQPPVQQDPPVLNPDIDECPRADGLNCF